MINDFVNAIKRASESQIASVAQPRMGTISGYDPTNYAVRVMIQPDGVESGWLPLATHGVGGAAFVVGPNIGDQVVVIAQEGAAEHGIVVGRIFDTQGNAPNSGSTGRPVQSGEAGLFCNGAWMHFAGGTIYLQASVIAMTGSVTIDGNVTTMGTIASTGDQIAGAISQIMHVHGSVTTGTADTGLPIG